MSWINPATPGWALLSVIKHEYGHELQCRVFGGDGAAMFLYYGGCACESSRLAVERVADAVALKLGASFTHYTTTPTVREWQEASDLLAGRR